MLNDKPVFHGLCFESVLHMQFYFLNPVPYPKPSRCTSSVWCMQPCVIWGNSLLVQTQEPKWWFLYQIIHMAKVMLMWWQHYRNTSHSYVTSARMTRMSAVQKTRYDGWPKTKTIAPFLNTSHSQVLLYARQKTTKCIRDERTILKHRRNGLGDDDDVHLLFSDMIANIQNISYKEKQKKRDGVTPDLFCPFSLQP